MSDISKLNSALFDQLERLGKATGDDLPKEIERSQAVSGLAKQIVDAGALVVSAERVRQEFRSPLAGTKLLESIK